MDKTNETSVSKRHDHYIYGITRWKTIKSRNEKILNRNKNRDEVLGYLYRRAQVNRGCCGEQSKHECRMFALFLNSGNYFGLQIRYLENR